MDTSLTRADRGPLPHGMLHCSRSAASWHHFGRTVARACDVEHDADGDLPDVAAKGDLERRQGARDELKLAGSTIRSRRKGAWVGFTGRLMLAMDESAIRKDHRYAAATHRWSVHVEDLGQLH